MPSLTGYQSRSAGLIAIGIGWTGERGGGEPSLPRRLRVDASLTVAAVGRALHGILIL